MEVDMEVDVVYDDPLLDRAGMSMIITQSARSQPQCQCGAGYCDKTVSG